MCPEVDNILSSCMMKIGNRPHIFPRPGGVGQSWVVLRKDLEEFVQNLSDDTVARRVMRNNENCQILRS